MSRPTWPTQAEYDLAMQALDVTVHDNELRRGRLAQGDLGIVRLGGAGLYTCLYKVDDWVVRCFCSNPPQEPPEDIKERYHCIAGFYRDNQEKISALLPTYYIDPGIDVHLRDDNQRIIELRTFPLVKMRFLKAPKLGDFIAAHYREKEIMKALSDAWLRMICELEDARMAHGDLDLTNVLVAQQGTNLSLKLIDYDNVWIPALGDGKFKQTEHGHPAFQHPAYLPPHDRPYDAHMDRFSALVMYISLKALAVRPKLYCEFGADEAHRLLLSASDFHKEDAHSQARYSQAPDSHIERLYSVAIDDINDIIPYLNELRISLSTGQMPARLDSIVPQQAQVELRHSLPVFLFRDDDADISSPQFPSPPQQSSHNLPVYLFRDEPVNSKPSRGQAEAPQTQPISSEFNPPEVELPAPPPRVQPIKSQPQQRFPIVEAPPPSRVQEEPPQSKQPVSRQEPEVTPSRTQADQQQPRPAPPMFNQQDIVEVPANAQPQQPEAQAEPIPLPVQPSAVDTNIPIEDQPTRAEPPRSFPPLSAADANAPTEPIQQLAGPPLYSPEPQDNIPPAPVVANPVALSPASAQVQQAQATAFEQDTLDSSEGRDILIGAIFFIILFLAIATIIVIILWRVGILHLGMVFPPANPSTSGSMRLAAVFQAALYLFPVQHLRLPLGLYRRPL